MHVTLLQIHQFTPSKIAIKTCRCTTECDFLYMHGCNYSAGIVSAMCSSRVNFVLLIRKVKIDVSCGFKSGD